LQEHLPLKRSHATSLEVGHGASTTGRISKAAGAIGEACEEGGVEKNALGAMGSRHERWMDGLLLGFLGLPTTRLTIPRSRNSPKLRMLAPRPETMWILLLTGTFLDSPSVGGPGSKSVGDFRTQFLTVGMMFIRILWGSDVIQHNTMTVS
jgi:hypothetical protein